MLKINFPDYSTIVFAIHWMLECQCTPLRLSKCVCSYVARWSPFNVRLHRAVGFHWGSPEAWFGAFYIIFVGMGTNVEPSVLAGTIRCLLLTSQLSWMNTNHYVTYQRILTGEAVGLTKIITYNFSDITFIRSRGRNHRQMKASLKNLKRLWWHWVTLWRSVAYQT
jgi:hypothetical protein